MRAPGECPGTYALECAIDELAHALKMYPLELRRVNYAEQHPISEKPWSGKHLQDCYDLGAEKFGWKGRPLEPRSMTDHGELVGWGMATATYPANQWRAKVHASLHADGTAEVQCATHDLGTGAYTALTQISADALGLPVEKVTFRLGSSDYPFGPVAGGSNSTATVGSAIADAGRNLRAKLATLASADRESPLHGIKPDELDFVAPGYLGTPADASKQDPFTEILRRGRLTSLEIDGELNSGGNDHLSFHSFGAQFCEVRIDPDLPQVRLTRVVSVMDCGRVINLKTGASQIIGGVVMGIGMALEEATIYDPATGIPVNRNLADYHVPVNADIISIEPYFVGQPDLAFNPMGARGMGEIGITGMAAAVANAVFHATGRRIRELPITPDKLL
jgi:xanthine dehydrogenase YagR molybdenum-binding subunit